MCVCVWVGACTDENWLELAKPVIEQRINKYANSEIRFNLMAIIANRQAEMQSTLAELEARERALQAKLDRLLAAADASDAMEVASSGANETHATPQVDDGPVLSKEQLQVQLRHNRAEQDELRTRLQHEEAKFKRWKVSRSRPFAVPFTHSHSHSLTPLPLLLLLLP